MPVSSYWGFLLEKNMILNRDWDEFYFLAENKEEQELLQKLYDSITDMSESYEDGEVYMNCMKLTMER